MMLNVLDAQVFCCDFHRDKLWQEWSSKIESGVAQDKQEVQFSAC